MKEEEQLRMIYNVPLGISAVLGSTKLKVAEVLKLTQGSVVELDKRVGDPIDVVINGRVVARGEIVLVEDKVGITLTEIVEKVSM